MTALQALNYSIYQKYGTYSPPRQKISETEYWEKYYDNPNVVYEVKATSVPKGVQRTVHAIFPHTARQKIVSYRD